MTEISRLIAPGWYTSTCIHFPTLSDDPSSPSLREREKRRQREGEGREEHVKCFVSLSPAVQTLPSLSPVEVCKCHGQLLNHRFTTPHGQPQEINYCSVTRKRACK